MAESEDQPLDYVAARVARGLGEPTPRATGETPDLDAGDGGPHDPGMPENERLAKVENSVEWLKWGIGLMLAATLFGFGFVGAQLIRLDGRIDQLGNKIDAIGPRISEEASRTRQELVGIATAISNSITAARQMQPPAPPPPPPPPQPRR